MLAETGPQSAEAGAAGRERPRPLRTHAPDGLTAWDRTPKAVWLLAEAAVLGCCYDSYES